MIIGGVATTFLWRAFDLSGIIYEVAPGICTGLIIYLLFSGKNSPTKKVDA